MKQVDFGRQPAQSGWKRYSWLPGGWSWGRWVILSLGVFMASSAARGLYVAERLIGPDEDYRSGPRALGRGPDKQASFADYRDTAWVPVRDLFAGGNPYDAPAYLERHPYVFEFSYTPGQFTVFGPTAVLPLPVSSAVWFVALLLATLLVAAITVVLARGARRLDLVIAIGAGLVLLWPWGQMLTAGQTGMLPLVATLVALVRRRSDGVIAVCLTLAWLKPQFGLPLTVLLLATGERRSVGYGLAGAAALAIPPTIWLSINAGGPRAVLESLPTTVDAALSSPSTRPDDYVQLDLASLLNYLFDGRSGLIVTIASSVVVLAVGAWAVARLQRRSSERASVLLQVAAAATVLLSAPHAQYDRILIVPAGVAAFMLALRALPRVSPVASVWVVALLVGLSVIPRGAPTATTRELLLVACAAAVLAVILVWPGGPETLLPAQRRRRAILVAVGALLLGSLYVGVDAIEPEVTAIGLLPALALLGAWLVSVVVAAHPHHQRSGTRRRPARLQADLDSAATTASGPG